MARDLQGGFKQISHEEVDASYGSASQSQLKSLGKSFWSFSSTTG